MISSESNSALIAQLQSEIRRVTADTMRGKTALALVGEVPSLGVGKPRVAWTPQPAQPVQPEPDKSNRVPSVIVDVSAQQPDDSRVQLDQVASVEDLPSMVPFDAEDEPTAVSSGDPDVMMDEADIDLGDDWEDFDVSSAYDDVLSQPLPDELRKTAEIDADDIILADE